MPLDSIQLAARDQFARQSECYGSGHILERVDDLAAALPLLKLPSCARVLDVATGGGHTGLFFARQGHDVTLSDLTPTMLEQAARAAAAAGVTVTTREHPAEQMPYPENQFDLVTCRIAPHHFASPAAFVDETTRVLKPGGQFLLVDGTVEDGEPEAEAWAHRVEQLRDPSHHRLLTPGTWRSLCQNAGLRVEQLTITWFKQPDLEWYFEVAATPAANRIEVLRNVENAPESARKLFRLARENGRIVWWWQRLTLIATKFDDPTAATKTSSLTG